MYTKEIINKIASRIITAAEIKYTTKGSGAHVFKKGKESIAVYDNPKAVKRFNVVLSGKDWEDGSYKTVIRMSENGNFIISTAREDASLGQPVMWSSFPQNLKKTVLDQMKGGYDTGYTQED